MRFFNRINIIALSVLWLTACSNTDNLSESETSTSSSELKVLSQELLDTTQLKKAPPSQEGELSDNEIKPNQTSEYLRQQKQIMASLSQDTIRLYQNAVEEMKKQHWDKANQLFQQVIELEPTLSGSYLNQAIIAKQQDNTELAEALVKQALTVNPLNPYAHNFNGILARTRGDFELAEQSYISALSNLPNYAEAHLNLAILSELYRGKLQLARRHYQAYLAINQDDQKVQRWLASLSLKLNIADAGR